MVPKNDTEQLLLFEDYKKRTSRELLEDTIEELCGRLGKKAITYACLPGDLKIPDDGCTNKNFYLRQLDVTQELLYYSEEKSQVQILHV